MTAVDTKVISLSFTPSKQMLTCELIKNKIKKEHKIYR